MKTEVAKKVYIESKKPIATLILALITAYSLTVTVFITYSLLIRYSKISENSISLVVTAVTLISVMIAGFDTARGVKRNGWIWGMFAGFIYSLILVIIGVIVSKGFEFDLNTLFLLILSIAGGGLGGIIGVNFAQK